MAQNITLLGASYTDVPSVQLPKTGGGMASFDDTTDADAVASDIAQGKTAYVNGVKLTGTGSGGGSGTRIETGTFKLTSDFSLTTSAQKITGLQLSFKPDYFMFTPDRASFEERASYSSGLWELVAFKKSLFPPYASSSSLSPEAVTTNDYGFFYRQAVTQNTDITCGYGVGGMSFLSQSYYSRYSVNDDGTISVGRYSSASTKIWAGTYKYIAIKF